MPNRGFSTAQACRITGLSARQLGYWCRTGLLLPTMRTGGGHARYSFTDLIVLRTARKLLDRGVSLQRIRKCLQSLSRFLPDAGVPLHELSLVVTGDVVLVLHSRSAFDALTGQEWILPVAEVLRDAQADRAGGQVPHQWDLFADGLTALKDGTKLMS